MNKKKTHSSLHSSPLILHGQIAFLSRHGSTWFLGNAFAASLFILLRWVDRDENMLLLMVWYASILTMNVMRWLFGQRFLPSQHYSLEELQEFGQRYLTYSTLISALWGVSGFILFSQTIPTQAVHILLLAGAIVAAMPVLALSSFALYVQIGAILLPVTLNLLLLGAAPQQSLALATILLAVLLVMASRSITSLLNDLHAVQIQVQEQAHTDPVTQISNRRYFDSTFKTEWRRAAREGKPLSLLMIDVDYFKRYNDKHGHQAGDQCLQIIAQCIKAVARRASDVVARHGGEEFVILLPDTSLEDAVLLAERVRKSVEDQRVPHSDGAIPRIVTVSVGVSSCTPNTPHNAQSLHEASIIYPAMLMNAADRALYRAKRNGRNQVAKESCGEGIIQLNLPSTAVTHAA
ncbi:diguanylate cyclase (GGDEF) domain-containing protein [Thiothrix caldifontis]|uniref:diguanylate cyclase n=1 Tax=Thiothrix caldifontis TaxID=525918 RepID=A0A1H3Z4Z1_9GAMM|nr:diguanylate cyclase [Thiothrix caldifontis]SEA18558.1 diguanylate cyclase (GGDEF) domain-containing protein [Thiothrix caldifontis]